MPRYLILVEPAEGGFSAYVPDVPGCAATGSTREEAGGRIRSALKLHVEGLREDGEPMPPPVTSSEYVAVG